jgi:hypothetical protein
MCHLSGKGVLHVPSVGGAVQSRKEAHEAVMNLLAAVQPELGADAT